jgi:hypothetical protein
MSERVRVYRERPDRSGLGIASFVMGLITLAGAFFIFILMLAEVGSRVVTGLGLCGGGIFALVGLGLGIAGAIVQRRNRWLAILGAVFNLVYLSVGSILLLVLLLN